MNRCVLLIGGNLGNVLGTFFEARKLLAERVGEIESESSVYISSAWGFESDEPFYNQVLIVNTNDSAEILLNKLLEIETHFGRTRIAAQGYQSRTLDLDILFFNQEIIHTKNLQIPHPRLHLRNFTLIPLAELMPDFVHPVLGLTIKQLLNQSNDTIQVHKL
jgi:2-amino-4-hydroxy-6-hydroxymethyldihydropteridine diphosphokinase